MRFSLVFATVALALITSLISSGSSMAWAAPRDLPKLPVYAVYDETKAFSHPLIQALQRVVAEHTHLTGEPIFIGIFKNTGDEGLNEFSLRLLAKWRAQFQDRNNIILMVIDREHQSARILSGFAMETQLPQSRADAVVDDFIRPELKAEDISRAAVLGTIEILRILESPLVQSGEAQKLFRAGGFQGGWQPVQLEAQRGFGIFLFVGALFILGLTYQVLAAEAIYTSRGWTRIPPWKIRLKRKHKLGTGLLTGGGASGRW
jgi:uncharacterized membrane protein YgcG